MRVTITIDCDNAAFYEEGDTSLEGLRWEGPEVARILKHIAACIKESRLRTDYDDMMLKDINGNTVGEMKVTA